MKKLVALALLLCSAFSVCCAVTPKSLPATRRAPDIVEVRMSQTFDLAIHVDTDLTEEGQRRIISATQKLRRVSHDSIRLVPMFDLNFDSVSNLKEHREAHHSLVIAVTSDFPIAQALDSALGGPGRTPMAATVPQDDGSFVVFFIMDRISADDFEAVVMHEFGHVAGFPDLELLGAVMSGAQVRRCEVSPCRRTSRPLMSPSAARYGTALRWPARSDR